MAKIKVTYLVEQEKEIELTTREWCDIHSSRENLRKILAKENNYTR